jgi:3-methylfumaryl-CoA hydratase
MTGAFEDWIGHEVVRDDVITPRLAAEYRATMTPFLFETGDYRTMPPGLHWGVAPATPLIADTGPDGAEKKGSFLPPIPSPRRMWAGGSIETLRPLRLGSAIQRISRIADIKFREGRAGSFYVLSVTHEITDEDGLAITERQDLAFRDGPPKSVTEASPSPSATATCWTVEAGALLLFRFSAFTFNGHRIHYDPVYAASEGYPGLVVHGPMQAALMLNMAASKRGAVPRRFDYRCIAPLFGGHTFTVCADDVTPAPHVRVIRHDGVTTAEGQVHVQDT